MEKIAEESEKLLIVIAIRRPLSDGKTFFQLVFLNQITRSSFHKGKSAANFNVTVSQSRYKYIQTHLGQLLLYIFLTTKRIFPLFFF